MKTAVTFTPTTAGKIAMVLLDDEFKDLHTFTMLDNMHQGLAGICLVGDLLYACSASMLYVFDLELTLLRDAGKVGGGVHGLCHLYGTRFCIASTSEDSIVIYDVLARRRVLKLVHVGAAGNSDTRHVNSVEVDPHHPSRIAVTVHNNSGEGYVYARGVEESDDRYEVLDRQLTQPHDFKFLRDGHLICDSQNRILRCSRVPIDKSWEKTLPGYTRGLAVYENQIVVGFSRRSDGGNIGIQSYTLDGGPLKERTFEKETYGNEVYAVAIVPEPGEPAPSTLTL